jgi:hypothetical protein
MSQHNHTTFILSWDNYGLESCINATELDMQHTLAILSNTLQSRTSELQTIMNQILLRAKANGQRHYEVYSIQVDSSITANDLKQQFEECPQDIANLIRDKGCKIYSGRQSKAIKIC